MSKEQTPFCQSIDRDAVVSRKDSDSKLTGKDDKSIKSIKSLNEEAVPEVTYPEGGTRGWFVAAGAAGILFSTFGYANAFGVFQEYYQSHQLRDSTPSQISWIGSIQLFFLFSAMLFGGPLFDQYGAVFLPPSAAMYVFSVMMTSLCTKYWHFMLAQGVLGGLSIGMTMAPCMAATGHYFNKKRGAAMGLVIAGSSLGGVMFPLALGKMLYNPSLSFGWSIRICGFIMLALLAPACITIRARLPPRKGRFLILAAFNELKFTSIVASTFLMLMGTFMPFFFLPSFAVSRGMNSQLAADLVSVLNAASFFGRVIPGFLGDKLGRLNMLFLFGICTGVLVFCFELLNSNATIIVFTILYGFCQGAIISSMTVSLSTIPKDQRDMGTYMGMGMAVMSIAVLIGPPINGAFITRYHGYNEVSYFSGTLTIIGGLGIIVTKYADGKGFWTAT